MSSCSATDDAGVAREPHARKTLAQRSRSHGTQQLILAGDIGGTKTHWRSSHCWERSFKLKSKKHFPASNIPGSNLS
jgi:hypothetical protein